MAELSTRKVTRRSLLAGGVLLFLPSAAGCAIGTSPAVTPSSSTKPADVPTQAPATGGPATPVPDLKTGADVAKAEAEGRLVYYGYDSDSAITALLDAFKADFPRIKTTYVRTQPGALYAKLISERTAKAFQCDVLQICDIAAVLDFQKNGGYQPYLSPQTDAYRPEHLSKPAGLYFWAGVNIAGLAFNTTEVKPADGPARWQDILDPKWTDTVSVNLATAGSQFVNWYVLRNLYGKDFWKDFGRQKPKAFATNSQLYDRLAKADDRLCGLAEYPGFVANKNKGAAIQFVAPGEGVSVLPSILGMATYTPHPEAAKLFLDWAMSARGQAVYQAGKNLYYGSVRAGAPPLPTGVKVSDLNLLFPSDWADFVASQKAFVEEWNTLIGM